MGSVIVFTIFLTVSLIMSSEFSGAIKQYINLLAVCIAVISAFLINHSKQSFNANSLMDDYELATLLTGIILAIQIAVFIFLGQKLGQLDIFGGDRIAYGAVFSDYSFLSLYLATGATIQLVKLSSSQFSWKSLFTFPFLLGMSAATSARTGVVACVLSMIIILFRHIIKRNIIYRPFIYVLFVTASIVLSIMIVTMTRADALFSSSGRTDNYQIAFSNFINHPFWGTGLGITTYFQTYGTEVPHNLILQYLAQAGFFSASALFVFIISISAYAAKTSRIIFEPFITILIGSMFIPDILNSRFFIVLVLSIITFRKQAQIRPRSTSVLLSKNQ